jgi:ubiquinone/menaquinone biosynthesis C-methylase UbiE
MTEIDCGSLLEMLYAYQGSAILMGSHKLGIYDALADGPLTAQDVASRLGAVVRSTELLLNACATLGLVAKDGDRYRNSEVADTFLVRGKPGYLGRVVTKEQEFYGPWGRLADAVRSDQAQLPPMKERLREDSTTAQNFLLALHDLALLNGSALPDYVNLSGRRKMLDVGGGVGSYSILLAQKNPQLRAVILDLPPVRELAEETVASYGLSERISFQAGDFTSPSLGSGYDVVLLANILHDNSEDSCRELLRKAHQALTDHGQIVVVEFHLDEDGVNSPVSAIFSLLMMLENQGAAEYPATEIKRWLMDAGFQDPVAHRLPEPSAMVAIVAQKGSE